MKTSHKQHFNLAVALLIAFIQPACTTSETDLAPTSSQYASSPTPVPSNSNTLFQEAADAAQEAYPGHEEYLKSSRREFISGFIDARTGQQPDAIFLQQEGYMLDEHGMLVSRGSSLGSGVIELGGQYADGWNKAKKSRGTPVRSLADLSRELSI